MNILNQFSYVLISLAIIAASLLVLRRYEVDRRLMAALSITLMLFSLTGYLLLRPGASDVSSTGEAQTIIQNGKPTFLEFFSNYCAGCLAVRPAVDLLVDDIEDEFNILRIDIHTEFGRELRDSLGFTSSPEFILLDAEGKVIWRDHTLPSRERLAAAANNAL